MSGQEYVMKSVAKTIAENWDKAIKVPKSQYRPPREPPARLQAQLEAHTRMRQEYFNQYVAFREVWDGDRLVEPVVLAVARTSRELRTLFEQLSVELTFGAQVRFFGSLLPGWSGHVLRMRWAAQQKARGEDA